VCNEAAETIHQLYPQLPFTLAGDHSNLDRQIAELKRKLPPPPM
jgi:hypothetical protein